jgi:tetratricopeptide (TPR) repeat protein
MAGASRRFRVFGTLRVLLCSALVALAGAAPLTAEAQVPARAPEREGEASARGHFDRALELYRAGQYARARDELKAAASLDPGGKDLFFNLALVHEKLGDLEAAIAALERFRELEGDAAERERAGLTIQRLRGAQQAAAQTQPPAPAAAPCPEPAPAAPSPRGSSPSPSASPMLIGAAATSVVALVVGTVFGVKALSDDVGDERTSTSLSVAQLRERARRAEQEALVADVAFAVAAASATTFVCVWLLSPSEPTMRSAGLSFRGSF